MLNIKILGSGCKNCVKLFDAVSSIVKEMDIDADIKKEEDFQVIMKYGVMRTPGLVINEKVKSFGKIPKKNEITNYIKEEL